MLKRITAILAAAAMVFTCSAACAEGVKKERVFVVADAAGQTQTIIDNIQLSNPERETILIDRTSLSGIENVGGHETFTQNGEELTWQADGSAIHYQGQGSKALPMTPVVTFTMDGVEVPAAEVCTQSGRLTMQVTYTGCEDYPMLALTVLPVPDGVGELSLENAFLLDGGSSRFLIGYGVPGAEELLDLPASFTVTCEADHADLGWMMTVAANDPIEILCGMASEKLDGRDGLLQDLTELLTALRDGTELPVYDNELQELAEGLTSLLSGASQLADGAAQLKDGAANLSDGAAQLAAGTASLATGASSLETGAASLESGLTTLTQNNDTLNTGASQLFDAILVTANQQLAAAGLDAAGIVLPELTRENYAAVLDGTVAQLNTMLGAAADPAQDPALAAAKAAADALTGLKTQLDQVNTFVVGLSAYTDGVSQAQAGSAQLHSGAAELSGGAQTLDAGAGSLSAGAAELSSGAAALSDGASQLQAGLRDAVQQAADRLLPFLADAQRCLEAFRSTEAACAAAASYDLAADGTATETVYIIRTDLK